MDDTVCKYTGAGAYGGDAMAAVDLAKEMVVGGLAASTTRQISQLEADPRWS